jgi:hypothetical protein
MARCRLLYQKVVLSRQLSNLSDDTSRLAFTWLIPFGDREGRTRGDPGLVCALLFPRRRDITDERMENYIREWHAQKLVIWYRVDGDLWLAFTQWEKHQRGFDRRHEPDSEIPAPPEWTPECPVDVTAPSPEVPVTKAAPRPKLEPLPESTDILKAIMPLADQLYEGRVPADRLLVQVEQTLAEYGPEDTLAAAQKAIGAGGHSWAYVRTILEQRGTLPVPPKERKEKQSKQGSEQAGEPIYNSATGQFERHDPKTGKWEAVVKAGKNQWEHVSWLGGTSGANPGQ